MSKTYITPNRVDFITGITVNGRREYIDFAPRQKGQIKTGTYATSNPDYQDALENDPRFGEIWILVEEETVAVPTVETPKDPGIKNVPKEVVSHFQTAKKYLIDNGFATSEEVRSKEQVIAVAEKNKVVFSGWNKDALHS